MTSAADEASRLESQPDGAWVARVTALGVVGFALAWIVVLFVAQHGLYGAPSVSLQVDLYRQYATDVLKGQVPYRDFALEYPPLSLVPILLPALVGGPTLTTDGYQAGFEVVMAAIGMLTLVVVVRTAQTLALGRRGLCVVAALMAASPILVGPLLPTRYDLWPVLLTAATMWAIASERYRVAALALGLAILAKVYPVVLLPLIAIYLWRRDGLQTGVHFGLITITTVFLGVAPFYLVAPDGILDATVRAFQRPLQVESIGASLMYLASVTFGSSLHMVHTFDSYNLEGAVPDLVGTVQTIVLGAAGIAIVVLLFRGKPTRDRLVLGCAAALTAYVAFGRVLSPQYVIWLIAPVAIVRAHRWQIELVALVVALLLTSWYYPRWYVDYYIVEKPIWVAVVVGRNFVLAGLAVYLIARLVPPKRPAVDPGSRAAPAVA